MTMVYVISDIVLFSLNMFGMYREMFRMRDAMANLIWQMVLYTFKCDWEDGRNYRVIPDFLAYWHTSGKIMFSKMSAIYVLFSLCLKAGKPNQMAWSF